MNIRERYHKFKEWQREPFHFENKSEGPITCANCGASVEGNYCPICGQKASVGRLTWKSVRQNISMLWGLESRSMLYTLLQLFVRPGHLIGDYLDGKRKQNYPPVKLLFIVGIVVVFIGYLYGLYNPSPAINHRFYVDSIIFWCETHPAWGGLALCMMVEFSTWLLFRFSPQHYKHTLPEGFFIQVYIAPIIIILSCLTELSGYLIILLIVYYIFVYNQLFGYSLWGTIWRTLICLVDMILIVGTFYLIEGLIRYLMGGYTININAFLALFITALIITTTGYYISKKNAKRRSQQQVKS